MAQKKSKSNGITANLIKNLEAQAKSEIEFARKYKENRIAQWHINEALYHGKKNSLEDVRANAGIANSKTQGFVNALLSKIDAPPNIKYRHAKEADMKPARRLNLLFMQEMAHEHENLQMKDLIGKKQAIIYGRAVYEYHASSDKKYRSVLSNVSVYDFLIDPSAGGLDIERAFYLGRGGIWKTKEQLRESAKSGRYISAKVKSLVGSDSDDSEDAEAGDGGDSEATKSEEEKAKEQSRVYIMGTASKIHMQGSKYLFWEWYTTYRGQRYYMLFHESTGTAVRVEKMETIFKSGLYPFWTWATDPDLEEFWTLSPVDQMRDIFMVQGASIDQLLDNAEQINKPMKGVVGDSVKNLNSLRYGRDKTIRFKKGTDLRTAVRVFETPALETPLLVYNTLETIGALESGVSPATKGLADEDKVGIYEGNLQQVADRMGLLNKSYADGYYRFAKLFYHGVKEHMTAKYAIEVIGENGVELEEISKKDIGGFAEYGIDVQASDAELQASINDQKNKLTYLQGARQSQTINQKVREEMEAEIVGFTQDEIRRLMDVSEFGDSELLSEASRDIERLLMGDETLKANMNANNAYKQRIVDYMFDQHEHMDAETWQRFVQYVLDIEEYVIANTVRKANEMRAKKGELMLADARGEVPPADPNQQGSPVSMGA